MTEQILIYRRKDPFISALPEALVVALGALALYAATMPRLITFEDAGLFDSVCYTNGISHPPGYPLFTLICAPLYHLPFEPAIIGNSISAVFGALACGMLVAILRLMDCNRLVAMFGGALLAVSAAFWSQAIIVEVYALNAFIFLCVLYLCLRFNKNPSRKLAWLICLGYSLGIANHWPLMVLAFPGLALICLARWDWVRLQITDVRFWAMVLAMVLLGISPYATMLMKKHLIVSYSGPINSLGALWDYFMRKSYATVDHQAGASIIDKVHYFEWVTRQMAVQATPWALPLLVPALLTGHKRIGGAVQLALVLVFLASTYGLVALLGFDYDFNFRAVFSPYPILAWCCLAIWFALGMQWLTDRVMPDRAIPDRVAPDRVAAFTGAGALLILALCVTAVTLTYFENARQNDRAHTTLASDYSRLVLKSVAKNAAVVTASDGITFTLAYQHFVRGMRPDVTLYHIDNVVFPNKLPGDTEKARAAAVETMAKRRPTYSISVTALPLRTNYGFFARHGVPGDPPAAPDNKRLAAFRHRLIENYLAGKYVQPEDLNFVTELLLSFSDQLLNLGNMGQLQPNQARDLTLLEKTFSGKLMTLYFALAHPDFRMSGRELLKMAFSMEKHIPVQITNQDRAVFYDDFAALFLQGERGVKVNKPLARQLLLKSFNVWPTINSPGLCTLIQLHPPKGHLANTRRFRDHCKREKHANS